MDQRQRGFKVNKATGWIAGCAVAALLMLLLAVVVSRLVVLWCPRGENCKEIAQLMFWAGMFLGAAISIGTGLVIRNLVDRRVPRRPA